jgi:hypothetical protein
MEISQATQEEWDVTAQGQHKSKVVTPLALAVRNMPPGAVLRVAHQCPPRPATCGLGNTILTAGVRYFGKGAIHIAHERSGSLLISRAPLEDAPNGT